MRSKFFPFFLAGGRDLWCAAELESYCQDHFLGARALVENASFEKVQGLHIEAQAPFHDIEIEKSTALSSTHCIDSLALSKCPPHNYSTPRRSQE